ncbi:hypothetical protein BDM02DRAFT_3186695 [Thelephora ganbajun]|uniref:Uncharacterized protein n=1 Tax=Thelephora ganbajun TaxID=370292 RepID=A0ACB6ZIH0_THEGA|nr:hypothetical protein BDM02DRAFT_3186695 [Thelephora ganbajun]
MSVRFGWSFSLVVIPLSTVTDDDVQWSNYSLSTNEPIFFTNYHHYFRTKRTNHPIFCRYNSNFHAQYKTGDFVEYRPIGGASDDVSYTKGEIKDIFEAEDGSIRCTIRNENTSKVTNHQEPNIIGKTERN